MPSKSVSSSANVACDDVRGAVRHWNFVRPRRAVWPFPMPSRCFRFSRKSSFTYLRVAGWCCLEPSHTQRHASSMVGSTRASTRRKTPHRIPATTWLAYYIPVSIKTDRARRLPYARADRPHASVRERRAVRDCPTLVYVMPVIPISPLCAEFPPSPSRGWKRFSHGPRAWLACFDFPGCKETMPKR